MYFVWTKTLTIRPLILSSALLADPSVGPFAWLRFEFPLFEIGYRIFAWLANLFSISAQISGDPFLCFASWVVFVKDSAQWIFLAGILFDPKAVSISPLISKNRFWMNRWQLKRSIVISLVSQFLFFTVNFGLSVDSAVHCGRFSSSE